MPAFYYVVRAKLIRHIKNSGEIEFLQFEDKFENDRPIIARNLAFEHYQNYVDVLLEAKQKKYFSDRQAREELKSFIEPGTNTKVQLEEREIDFSDTFGNGIGIFLIENDLKSDFSGRQVREELFIHGIGNINYSFVFTDSLIYALDTEYEEYYKEHNYDTGNQEIEVVYFDFGEWEEGYLGNGLWEESYSEPNTHKIIKTPFDRTGYDREYWWGEPKDREIEEIQQVPKTLEEIIQEGESNQVEFKPALLYNFSTQKAGIGVKGIIAKAICAFLNSNGGILFIGLSDNGEPQGLSHDFSLSKDKDEKDFFNLEFDQMVDYFLSFSVKSNISGEFYQIDNKDIFVVTVTPSKHRPIFLKGQNGKEFYVRGEASSRQLTDIEELANYCIEKWGLQ
jgi:hypothetical protein